MNPTPSPADAPVHPLPRAVQRPANAKYLLDGDWHFSLDPDDRGLTEKWYLGHPYTQTAQWPGTVEAYERPKFIPNRTTPSWPTTWWPGTSAR